MGEGSARLGYEGECLDRRQCEGDAEDDNAGSGLYHYQSTFGGCRTDCRTEIIWQRICPIVTDSTSYYHIFVSENEV